VGLHLVHQHSSGLTEQGTIRPFSSSSQNSGLQNVSDNSRCV
jgi:hypothetical protein